MTAHCSGDDDEDEHVVRYATIEDGKFAKAKTLKLQRRNNRSNSRKFIVPIFGVKERTKNC